MSANDVVIALSPGRLAVLSPRARKGASSVSVPIDAPTWEEAWKDGLRPLDERLRAAMDRLGVRKGRACVLHRAPTLVVEALSYPTGPAEAIAAARLSLADTLGAALDDHAWAIRVLARDRAGSPRQTHLLGAADLRSTCESIQAWLGRAGLALSRCAPADAGVLSLAVVEAVATRSKEVVATLHLGESGGVLSAGADGRLHFVRRVGVGVDALVSAIQRGAESKGVSLAAEDAGALLARHGVPEPSAAMGSSGMLHGRDVLPAMQPALQRLVVEVRQSLRFGLDDEAREGVRLVLAGPGACIPGLAEALGTATERPFSRAEVAAGESEPALGDGADLALAGSGRVARISLRSPAMRSTRLVSQARFAMRAGAAAAAVLLSADAALAWRDARETRGLIAQSEAAAEEARRTIEEQRGSAGLSERVASAESRVAEALSGSAEWGAFLGEVALRTPETVRLNEIAAKSDFGRAVAELRGFALVSREQDRLGVVKGYIDALAACPLVERVELGETQRAEMDGREAQRFTVRATLVPAIRWRAVEGVAP